MRVEEKVNHGTNKLARGAEATSESEQAGHFTGYVVSRPTLICVADVLWREFRSLPFTWLVRRGRGEEEVEEEKSLVHTRFNKFRETVQVCSDENVLQPAASSATN